MPSAAQTPANATPNGSSSTNGVLQVQPKQVVHRAEVVYADGKLTISADNSSLLQILRDVARRTGMQITGGVNDEKVFGKYGPGSPSEILGSLLQGTGSNMLLRESADHAPVELVLTPRTAGGTLPPPISLDTNDDPPVSEAPHPTPQQAATASSTQTLPTSTPQPQPSSSAPVQPVSAFFAGVPASATNTSGATAAPVATPTSTLLPTPVTAPSPTPAATPISPNGVRTPQQIYQELQQLQNQLPASK